ncbi:MAG: hypothetical protein F6K39_19435, partial [Okeania sp. SIO3B3]|nr:hypothetical protein [Okeania sp. SIO3B3]
MDKHNPLIYLLGASSCLLLALNSKQTSIGAMAASLGGAILAQTAMSKASERFIDDEINVILRNAEISKFELAAQVELMQLLPQEAQAEIIDVQTTETISESVEKYDWEQVVDGNSLLIAGEPGSAKTSVTAGYIVPRISNKYESEIIVLDSHAKKNNWAGMGYHRVLHDYERIYNCLVWLDEEKERRRTSSEEKHLLIIIFDEINDMWEYLEKTDEENKTKRLKNAQAILRTLLNCRKFNIKLIGMMQSHLCQDLKISGASRRQALMILLNGAARQFAYDNKKALSAQQYAYVSDENNRPYCCLITGYKRMTVAEHPTHGHHDTFAEKGKKPENVSQPKDWGIVTIPFALPKNHIQHTQSSSIEPPENEDTSNNIIITEPGKFDLNKNEEIEADSEVPDSLAPELPELDVTEAVTAAIQAISGVTELHDFDIEAAFSAIRSGKNKSYVIKEVLKMK